MEQNKGFHFIQLSLAVIVMSSSGALGKFISVPVPVIIWTRCLIGGVALFAFIRFMGSMKPLPRGKDFYMVVLSSAFMGLHWLTYFWALKLSNVAIGMLSMFTYPVITALLEPLILKTPFRLLDIFLAVLAFSGVFILVPSFDFQNDVTLGILMGTLSALFYSFRNIITKTSVSQISGTQLMFYQLIILVVLLFPLLFFYPLDQSIESFQNEWIAVLLLALYTTAIGHTLLVKSFAHFSVTTVSILTCVTPLFGILQGYLFLNEKPTEQVLIGGSIILSSVIIESIRSAKN